MSKRIEFLSVILSAVLITFLFYKQALGINVFIFEAILLAWLAYRKELQFESRNQKVLTLGLFVTMLATVFSYSDFSYIWHFTSLFFFIGMLAYPRIRSLLNLLGISLLNVLSSQMDFIELGNRTKIGGKSLSKSLSKTRFFIIPLFIIIVFLFIYSAANPVFSELMGDLMDQIGIRWNAIFYDFEFAVIMTFICGIFISNFLLLRSANKDIVDQDQEAVEYKVRKRKRNQGKRRMSFPFLGLKNEFKAAIFLFVSLNIILAIVNGIDVYWVWFHFEWEGQYLKQFVHAGTYLLILSILLSIGLVLYFFRGNLNFYTKSAFLKKLSYLWLAQNALLALSVGMRNFWYIEYYALAYKRIGVFIFLLLTLYGLYSVYQKLKDGRSLFNLFRKNAFVFYVVMTFFSLFNWDGIITKYNFAHADKSFLHLNFLARMSDKTLVDMDKSMEELNKIQIAQEEGFYSSSSFSSSRIHYYLGPEEYYKRIQERKKEFKEKWEAKGFLSWNYPEYKAYKELFEKP